MSIANPTESGTSAPLFPNQFTLYQSQSSLAASTFSASSGYNIDLATLSSSIDQATAQFRDTHHNTLIPADPFFRSPDADTFDLAAFKREHIVIDSMLEDFVTMTCILLYYDELVQIWPNTDALVALAALAIDHILRAHAADHKDIVETR
jgi:hypothetical protein